MRGGRRAGIHVFILLLVAAGTPLDAQDSPESRRHLESLQLRAFSRLGASWKQLRELHDRSRVEWIFTCVGQRRDLIDQKAVAEKPLAQVQAECQALLDQMPSRLDDPYDYEVLRQRFDAVHAAAASLGRALPFRPLLGTVADGDFVAHAARPGHYVLVVDGGAWKASWRLAKILALSLPTLTDGIAGHPFATDWPGILRHLQARPAPLEQFRELVDVVAAGKHPYLAPRHLIDRDDAERLGFVVALNTAVQLFLVGHEYAHLAEGHLDGAIPTRPEEEFPSAPIRLGSRTLPAELAFTREFDADRLGLRLALKAFEALDPGSEAALWGAVLCLRASEILKKARGLGDASPAARGLGELSRCETEPLDGTHPPLSCRVSLLKQHARTQPDVLRSVELLERILEHLGSQVVGAVEGKEERWRTR